MPQDNAKMTKSARHQMPKNGQNAIRRRSRCRPHTWTPRVRTRAPGHLNLQCTSLMSVFAHSFTPLPFPNFVLVKLTINTFTGMCPAVSCGFQSYLFAPWFFRPVTLNALPPLNTDNLTSRFRQFMHDENKRLCECFMLCLILK